jgi:hypothetical protein
MASRQELLDRALGMIEGEDQPKGKMSKTEATDFQSKEDA